MKTSKYITAAIIAVLVAATCMVGAAAATDFSKYTVQDVTLVQKVIGKKAEFTQSQYDEYDFNGDGVIKVDDATYLQKVIAKKIPNGSEPATTQPPATTTAQPTQIAISNGVVSLGKGETFTLVATSDVKDYKYIFKSSDESIASVDENGNITANSAGTADITCSTQNGLEAICTVCVGNMAMSVSLNSSAVTLGAGESVTLKSSVADGTVAFNRIFSSSNTTVAQVDETSGVVKAKSAGSAEIRCSLSNGVYAKCSITVKNAPTSASLNASSAKSSVGKTYTMSYVTNSGSYSTTFTWKSSNTQIAQIQSTSKNKATLFFKKQGSVKITATTFNGISSSCTFTISGSVVKCIDVSYAQGNNIDFEKVKSAGYNYVILRAGYGNETSQKDSTFETNYKKAKAAGLKVGAYWFSYSMSPSESVQEANACLYCLKGKTLDMPLFYDMEYEKAICNLSNSTLTDMAANFCEKIIDGGFSSGVYASESVLDYSLNLNYLKSKYSIWNAQWGSSNSVNCDIWQYSCTTSVPGIYGDVDCSYIFNLNMVK